MNPEKRAELPSSSVPVITGLWLCSSGFPSKLENDSGAEQSENDSGAEQSAAPRRHSRHPSHPGYPFPQSDWSGRLSSLS